MCKNIVMEAMSVNDGLLQQWMAEHHNQILHFVDKDAYNTDKTAILPTAAIEDSCSQDKQMC